MRVLIADDHAPTLVAMREALETAANIEVCAAAPDAPSAIRLALETRPDICLLDLMMPGGGLGAIREISARLPTVPVVVITASDRDSDLFAALRNGASGYLPKDTPFSRLPSIVHGVLEGEAAIPRTLVAKMVQEFRAPSPPRRHVSAAGEAGIQLTSREWQVLEHLGRGESTAQVASRLGISPSSVRVHIHTIVRKLGAADRADALRMFRQLGDVGAHEA